MLQTFANLPLDINNVISSLLSEQKTKEWVNRAVILHGRYMERDRGTSDSYIRDYLDALAYLGLRTPATYAQIYGALLQIQETIPLWEPQSLLDIGSGPGTALWAAKTIWPSLQTAVCIDQEKHFLSINKEIIQKSSLPMHVSFDQQDTKSLRNNRAMYDVVVIANVLNELSISEQKTLLEQAYSHCSGIMIIVEPGTPFGIQIVQDAAKNFSRKANLLAPFVKNTFVVIDKQWIHFSQRFIRPEFQKRIRQHMRESTLMASDWEEAKYAYVAMGKIPTEEKAWGRVVGPSIKQKGFLEIPVLTEDGVTQVKVLKRYKNTYAFAKDLQWGDVIKQSEDVIEKIKDIRVGI